MREICARAGVSQGGLFRHFPTRKDLLVATLAELHDRQIAAMAEVACEGRPARRHRPDARRDQRSRHDGVVGVVRRRAHRRRARATASDRCSPNITRRCARVAEQHPSFAALSPESQTIWLDIAERVFQAEALWRQMTPPPDLGEAKLEALIALLDLLAKSDVR